jgi:uncharacterized membrane protein YbhN (UPF0104 family)
VVSGEGDGPSWLPDQIGKPHQLAAMVMVAAVLALGASVGVAWTIGFTPVWQRLLYPHWFWLLVALGGEAFAYIGYTLAYREIVRAEQGAQLSVPRLAALVATGFGVFVQGGGFALDRAALERAGLTPRDARSRVLGLGALEYAFLAPATALAALWIIVRGQPVGEGLTLPWLIGVPVGAGLALTALRHKQVFNRRGWRRHVYDWLRSLDLLLCLFRQPARGAVSFLGMGCYWLGDVFCLWATLHAFSARTPPIAALLVGYATGYALTRRALPLGGAGIVEALLPFALGWVAIARLPALLGVISYRIINLWLPLLPALAGLPSLSRLRRVHRAPVRRRV